MFRFAVGRLALVVRAAIAIQTSAAGGPPPVGGPARFTPGFWRGRGRAGCLSIRVQRWAGETKRPLPAKRLRAMWQPLEGNPDVLDIERLAGKIRELLRTRRAYEQRLRMVEHLA